MKTTVGVIFGCPSVEHEVSVVSALQAMNSLDEEKYDIFPMYVSKEGEWYWGDALFDIENFKDIDVLLKSCERILLSPNRKDGTVFVYPDSLLSRRPLAVIDVFLPITHGAPGEDGSLQGLLELTGIPYAGPGVLAAAAGMDKVTQKALCKMGGVPVLDCFWFYGAQWSDGEEDIIDYVQRKFSYPLMVKPADLGSSVGIVMVDDEEEFRAAVDTAARFTEKILVEKAIVNMRELNISVMGDPFHAEVSFIEEIPGTDREIFDFEQKYYAEGMKEVQKRINREEGFAERLIPADIPDELKTRIQDYALDAFYCMSGEGVWRFDFFYDLDEGRLYLNEVNTIPGSLAWYLWEPAGIPFNQLLDRLLSSALRQKQRREKLVQSFEANLLANEDFAGAK